MIIYHDHLAALAFLRQNVGHCRIVTRQMLDDGCRVPGSESIVFDRERNEYSINAMDDGLFCGVLAIVQVVARPGVCVLIGDDDVYSRTNQTNTVNARLCDQPDTHAGKQDRV